MALGALLFDPVLGAIGQWPYPLRIATCILLIAPAAFLMGFPFPTGMTMLSRLGKERFFLWAWGINGTFSVVGAVAVPIVNVLFGQQTLLLAAAALYLIALPAFFSLLKPAPVELPRKRRGGFQTLPYKSSRKFPISAVLPPATRPVRRRPGRRRR